MAVETSLNVLLTPELDLFVQSRVKSGRYHSSGDVVREALLLLERQEREREEVMQEVRAELAIGIGQAERGELRDGDEVFEELRRMIKDRREGRREETVRG